MSKFIVFEGPDGTGKSTLAKKASVELEDEGFDVELTKEPGGTKIGKKVREILLDPEYDEIHPTTETLLFFADRAQHYHQKIKNSSSDVIISDRYVISTFVYQHYLKGIDKDIIESMFRFSTDYLKPDVTFIIESDKPHNVKREDRFDQEILQKRQKLINCYHKFIDNHDFDTEIIKTDKGSWEDYKSFILARISKELPEYDYKNEKEAQKTW